MTFAVADYKEVGGPGNNIDGGQVHSCHSATDTLATMMADSYLDAIEAKLKSEDIVLLSGSDGVAIGQVTNTAGVITVAPQAVGAGAAQALAGGGGAANLTSEITNATSTGADVVTLADGLFVGQMKTITHVSDGGSIVITPANMLGFTTCTLLAVGDTCRLQWNGTGWIVIGRGGAVEPVIA